MFKPLQIIRLFSTDVLFLLLKPHVMRAIFFSLSLFLSSGVLLAQVQTGKASFYADKFEGTATASGEKYHHHKLTAAHKTLPFGTRVRVTNLSNNLSVE